MRSTQQPVQGIPNWCPDSPQHVFTPTSLLQLCQSVKEDPCSPSRAVRCGTGWWHEELWAMEICKQIQLILFHLRSLFWKRNPI